MRHIHALGMNKIPRNDEFHFRERAKVLVDKWAVLINPTPGAKTNGDKADTPTANGTAAATNGKKATKNAAPALKDDEDLMDQDGKADDAKSGSADAIAEDDAPMAGDESMLADVTMSEAA